jgi:hypothetical protein
LTTVTRARWLETVPAGRDLDRSELRALAVQIAGDRGGWEPFVRHDSTERRYVSLHRDAHLDVWLLTWSNEQDTGLHDHDLSCGAVHVCVGELVEDRLESVDRLLRRSSTRHLQGATFDFDASHVHCLAHPPGAAPAVSIHTYSPALLRMGHYEIGQDGLLRRTSVSYADEPAAR